MRSSFLGTPQEESATADWCTPESSVIAGPWRLPTPKAAPQRPASRLGPHLTHRLHSLFIRWRERVRERRRLRGLSMLDEQLLLDIGFTRAELLHEAAKPFWRAGTVPPETGSGIAGVIALAPCRAVYCVTRSQLSLPVRLPRTPPDLPQAITDLKSFRDGRRQLSREGQPFGAR
jgi:uncharacterized protein YjiS (DUF1127 family)